MELERSANEYFCLLICLLICIARYFLSSNGFSSTYTKLPFTVRLILTVEEKRKAAGKNPISFR